MITSYFDIIVLLVVVVIIYQKLKSLLGTRPEGVENSKIAEENAARIFDIIMKEAEKQSQNNITEEKPEIKEVNLSDTEKALRKIPGFDQEMFLTGAKRAFEIILEAFNKGDIETLEMLVNKNLLKKFQDIIEKRHAEGITSETDFIGFDKAEIIDAKVSKNAGKVIEGDDQYIQSINDKWTFEKALTSTNPNWMLVSTKK